MGRAIRGEQGFSYAYGDAGQPRNLLHLPSVSGAGVGLVVPELVGTLVGDDARPAWNCLVLGRSLLETGEASRQGELGALLRKLGDDWVRVDDPQHVSLTFVEDAMAENIVPLLERIDAAAPRPLRDLSLVGKSGYHLPRADFPKMLAFVNESLPRARQIDMSTLRVAVSKRDAALERAWAELRDAMDALPHMGLSILIHAISHDLEGLLVRDDEPEVVRAGFWDLALEWHGWLGDAPAADARSRFGRALAARFAGRADESRRLFTTCKEAGDERAARYLEAPRGGKS